MKRRIYIWSSILVAVVLAWLGHKAWLAHQNLVTLDVRDMDVREVLRKCEWQTWETIVVHKDVKGKVTYACNKVPLEEVLTVIGDQISARITAVYPIYSKNNSYVNLRKLARGDIYRDTAGWTNFVMQGSNGNNGRGGGGGGRGGGPGGGGGFGGFADTARGQNSLVTLQMSAKDLSFASLALARWSNAQIVPEDGANGLITVNLKQVPFTEAVAKVAKEAHRKWDVFYSVQAQQDFFAGRGGPDDGGGRRGFGRGDGTNQVDFTNRFAEFREERDAQREREMEARLATMTAEEQAKAKEDLKKLEEIRNLPPEAQQQAFQQLAQQNPQFGQRGEARGNAAFKNATPDQRVDRARRGAEMRARRARQTQ